MRELLQAGCELLSDNKNAIRSYFKWDMELLTVAGAVLFTSAGETVDIERMKNCRAILKSHEGGASALRGNMEIPVLAKMALAPDPEQYLIKLISIYDALQRGRIFASQSVAMAALTICDGLRDRDVTYVIDLTKQLMKRMSERHPFLTGEEDTPCAALLAMSGRNVDEIIDEMETCFAIMKKKFSFHSDAVQSLTQVLALCPGDPIKKCERVSAIYDAMVARGITYGKDYELASLGALVTIDMTPEELANEIADAAEFLKIQKGFGDWSMSKKTRLMFAALLAAQAYAPSSIAMDASVLCSTLCIVIAQQAAAAAAASAT